jgi:hypothetical protein
MLNTPKISELSQLFQVIIMTEEVGKVGIVRNADLKR